MLHIPLKKNFQCSNKNGSQKNLKKINTQNLLRYSYASPKNQVLKSDDLFVCGTAQPPCHIRLGSEIVFLVKGRRGYPIETILPGQKMIKERKVAQ